MKMTSVKMKRKLEERFKNEEWRTHFDRDQDTFRIEWKDSKQGVTISLPGVISKWENREEEALDELENHIREALKIMHEEQTLEGKEANIFPVIRSGSFPTESNNGARLIYTDHTAETRVYYAIDLGKSYRLIDEQMLKQENWEEDRIKEVAMFNVRRLSTDTKQEDVAGNTFYFLSTKDGYDASRILNEALLEKMAAQVEGELAVGVPHQDVCIFVDVKNKTGYDILAQMMMQFFAEGQIPITSLPFLYEDKKLEPIFILAQKKPKDDKE
ncbi:DUF1444 domain-containing protein [Tenuibacillus multivorans]|uniref:UPF0354 protein SAMN05216498_3115 n=1 Tax=Tenuibacillus multivorans TaxID=237069 RepID=A0A1H0EE42_9BACI|nr:DUF1444 domain-containing protein [Tenuibacillus multivorans]GEL77195.1 UPF0354 protein YtpQ [Tenuibacillus multivorans]SDN80613.1 Uncharacterized protein YtpQ, UPF0354 family [Tenuibacillus multivorans]